MKRGFALILVTVGIAACGSSGSHVSGSAMRSCLNTGASKAVCDCGFAKAQAAGISPEQVARAEDNGTAIQDQRLVKIATDCLVNP